MSKTKYKKQNEIIIIIISNKIKDALGAYLSRKKELGYIIPTINCYPRNG